MTFELNWKILNLDFELQQRRLMLKSSLSIPQIISRAICNQLTTHMDYKSQKLKFEASRTERSHQNALSYIYESLDEMKYLDKLEPEHQILIEGISSKDLVTKNYQHGLGKRISILKLGKSLPRQKPRSSQNRFSKRYGKSSKNNSKGLVKLISEQEEIQFVDFIDKMRQKKIKYDEAIRQSERQKNQKQNLKHRATLRFANNNEKTFITTFTGDVLKCETRQQNSKKDDIYLQKIRIKPFFKLRQHVQSRADVFKRQQLSCQTKRVSLSNQQDSQNKIKLKDQNYYIKSIIDVIANRKQINNIRKKRNANC